MKKLWLNTPYNRALGILFVLVATVSLALLGGCGNSLLGIPIGSTPAPATPDTTIAFVAAPVVSITAAPAAPAVIPDTTSATISFDTTYAGKCIVEWGTSSGSYPSATSLESSEAISHTLTMTNLAWSRAAPSPASTATYYYRIHSFSTSNGASVSEEFTLTTPTITDATRSQRLRGIWVVGGATNTSSYNTVVTTGSLEMFDPAMGATGTWYSTSHNILVLPTPVSFPAVVGVGGKVLVFGGFISTGAVTRVIQVYDVATNTWTSYATGLPVARAAMSAAVVSGYVYVFGGTISNANAGWGATPVTPMQFTTDGIYNATLGPNVYAAPITDRTAVTFNDVMYHLGGRTSVTAIAAANTFDGYKVNSVIGPTVTGTEVTLSEVRVGMSTVIYTPSNLPAIIILLGGAATVTNTTVMWPFSGGTAGGLTPVATAVRFLPYPFTGPSVWTGAVANQPWSISAMAFGAATVWTNGSGTARVYYIGGLPSITNSSAGSNLVTTNDLTNFNGTTLFPTAWSAAPTMPTARFGHAAVTVQ